MRCMLSSQLIGHTCVVPGHVEHLSYEATDLRGDEASISRLLFVWKRRTGNHKRTAASAWHLLLSLKLESHVRVSGK